MKLNFFPICVKYRTEILDILSYYMVETFSAIRSEPVEEEYFDFLLQLIKNYPSIVCVNEHNKLLGFAFLRAYNSAPNVRKTAVVTIFVKPEFTRQGIGSFLINRLIEQGREQGITNILADVISFNEESIQFHKKHNFKVCGHYHNIGSKLSRNIDMVLMQRQEDN